MDGVFGSLLCRRSAGVAPSLPGATSRGFLRCGGRPSLSCFTAFRGPEGPLFHGCSAYPRVLHASTVIQACASFSAVCEAVPYPESFMGPRNRHADRFFWLPTSPPCPFQKAERVGLLAPSQRSTLARREYGVMTPFFLDLRAQALLLLPELGSELGTEVGRLEHLANLNLRLRASGVGTALHPLDRLLRSFSSGRTPASVSLLALIRIMHRINNDSF